jgi:phosphonate transport system substrate-binding protein
MGRGALGFGIARSVDPVRSRARLAELCGLLSSALGQIFIPQHLETYKELTQGVLQGELGIAWMPPIPCVELEELAPNARLLLPVRGGRSSYFSALVARRDGPRTLAEVKAKRVAWVDPDSSSGYLVLRLHLRANGHPLSSMFAEESMAGSHVAVLDAVESGRADVGATYCATRTPKWLVAGTERQRPLDALTVAGPIPNDAIVLSAKMPEDLRERLQSWFIALDAPRARELCMDLLGADGFRVASFSHLVPLRKLVHAARYSAS